MPRCQTFIRVSDSHLQTLQVLSAHMKLLLDAPEHLWRLIEQEKYFHATWLFMLARVVHRALSQDEDQDEESWLNQGIKVMVTSPLHFSSSRLLTFAFRSNFRSSSDSGRSYLIFDPKLFIEPHYL